MNFQELMSKVGGDEQRVLELITQYGCDRNSTDIPEVVAITVKDQLGQSSSDMVLSQSTGLDKPKKKGGLTRSPSGQAQKKGTKRIPVTPIIETPATVAIEELGLEYVRQSEQMIADGSAAIALYASQSPGRFLAAIAAKQEELGIEDPTAHLTEAMEGQRSSLLGSIASMINQSNQELGIAGQGFDVRVDD